MFAIMGALIKQASLYATTEMVVFFRCLVGMLALLPWILRNGPSVLTTARTGAHLLRSVTGVAAMYCFFYAIAQLPLSTAVLLTFTAPLFIPLIAWLALRESVSVKLMLAILAGFIGIAFVLQPGTHTLSSAALIGLAGGVFAAAAMVTVRSLASSEPSPRIVFYYTLAGTIAGAVPMLFNYHSPGATGWTLLIGLALFATAGQILMARGYAIATAARMGIYTYAAVIFATLLGWLLWHETPDPIALIGIAIVILSTMAASAPDRYNPARSSRDES